MHLTAVVCTFNRYDQLAAAIESLFAQEEISSFDVIIVDNSPAEDRARAFASTYAEKERLTFLYENTSGLANARNVAARAARGDVIAYIDDDALASPNWARSILDAFESFGPDVAAVGGVVEALWSEPPPKWLSRRALDMLSIVDRGTVARELSSHEWLAGCNIAFRRSLLLETGGFPTHLGRVGNTLLLSNEEQLVCERLIASSCKVVYTPEARVLHRIPAYRVSPRWLVKRMAWQAISDAVSHPARSITHAEWRKSLFTSPLKKAARSIRFFWIMSRWKRSLTDKELEIVYDKFNSYICG